MNKKQVVSIKKIDSHFLIELIGMHKYWALKDQFTISAANIIKVHQDYKSIDSWWIGWRCPGTFIPFVITAGTYLKNDKKIFWDVSNKNNCIILELKDEEFDQLIIEVENPSEAIDLLTK